MGKGKLIAGLALMVLLLSAWPAGACGDKLLILGRGVRFQVDTANYPSAIVLFANPNHPSSARFEDTQLRSIMKQAGHRLSSVKSRDELATALKNGRYDLVLADFSDAPSLEDMVQAAPSKPVLLPWVEQGKKTDEPKAKARYGVVLKAPASVAHFLSTVDRTMEMKPKLVRLRTNASTKVSLLR